MEKLTPLEIIEATQNAPSCLNILIEKFIEIEILYNQTVSKLKNEKDELNNKVESEKSLLTNKYTQLIYDREEAFHKGEYIPPIVAEVSKDWKSSASFYSFLETFSIILGALMVLISWFAGNLWYEFYLLLGEGEIARTIFNFKFKVYLGFGLIAVGILIFSKIKGTYHIKIFNANDFIRNQEKIQRAHLDNLSDYLKNKLKEAEEEERRNLNAEIKRIEDEKNVEKTKLNSKHSLELKEQFDRANRLMEQTRLLTIYNIIHIKKSMNEIITLLNSIPESFDAMQHNWHGNIILKGKDSVASNFRIGSEKIIINLVGLNLYYKNKENENFEVWTEEDEKKLNSYEIDWENYLKKTEKNETKMVDLNGQEKSLSNLKLHADLLRISLSEAKIAQKINEEARNLLYRKLKSILNEYIDENIITENESIFVPVCIPFLNKSNIIFNCNNHLETKEAIRISHNIIARMLLALPANKTKITFIDPLELGVNAAPFTPLLREIYGGMVFTQQNDIETQLSILIRSIENVIQKYLQDKFTDIADYNLKTKEVPEPYRLLVVYNFPHGFNDTTSNKLLNIIKSGPKSGVNTILINDRNAKLPYGTDWSAFEGINIKEISLSISNNANRHFEFDQNLPYGEIVDYINKEFPNVRSIKVPFTKYIAPQSEWWQEKTHKRFEVPIGRHALEVQTLKFDNEDDNQALLIGKPGSGKSNLLHVIIANSLWKYSPDQLEIYLIDFKGGVEFTIYADKKIPHIRTIAIESEREFGLSVLEGVERELLRRETEFSKVGVQNIEQYHEKFPDERMPRVLLIVDEFQEFFTEEDNIKHAVDDKFDRIVRKGRAFGINTLFSSQTLSANSIKKSTKELIDIRIALMCSDLDSNQILDDRNPAAKDLTRPGEGIYNPDNGKVEGNRTFQAFFIDKDDLNNIIESVVSYSNGKEKGHSKFKQIIFRGSEKALMAKDNHPFLKVTSVLNPKSLRLWVGEPVAIADDVTAVIRKQGGSNLLVAGYDESIGLRVMCSSIISIAAQQQPKSCTFYSFNFYNVDSEFVNVPYELFNNIDQVCVNVNGRQVKETLHAIKQEIENRLSGSSTSNSNIYLTFFSLQRGRVFRKDGYSMSDEGNLLAYILKEGADLGVFSLVQVDTMDNFSKNLDDNLLKEFSQRIASQMNPDNSVKVIGNQKAAKLGSNRAWYYDDNENTMIKFKPYELPTFSWVAQLQKKQTTLS